MLPTPIGVQANGGATYLKKVIEAIALTTMGDVGGGSEGVRGVREAQKGRSYLFPFATLG